MIAEPAHLEQMLGRLKLTAIRDQLDSLLDEAAKGELTLRETLTLFCEREIARKDERRIEMAFGLAKFPFVRDLAGFDFKAQPSLDPKQIRDLATGRFVANGETLLLLGPPGVGKTHLAVAIGRSAILAGYAVLFIQATTLVAALARAHGEGRLEDKLTQFAKPRLLIVDELGYLPFEPDAAHLFFQLVSRRYERGSMLITSNRAIGEWGRCSAIRWWRRRSSTGSCTTATSSPSAATATGCARSAARVCSSRRPSVSRCRPHEPRLVQVGPQVPPAGLRRALEGARPAGPSRGLPGQASRDTHTPKGVSSSCRQGVNSWCRLTPSR